MIQCSKCKGGFCPECTKKLMADAAEAETYVRRLKSGDHSVIPMNDNHRRIKTSALRKQLSNSTPDCSPSKRK